MNNDRVAKIILRIGIALVFIWFGFESLMNPSTFAGLVPVWVQTLASAETLVRAHGLFEIVFGLLLLIGVWKRISALLLLLGLLNTIFLLPYGAIMIRDIGLGFALLSIIFQNNTIAEIDQ